MASLQKRNGIWYIYWYQNGKRKGRSLGTRSKQVANQYKRRLEEKLAKKQLGVPVDISLDQLQKEYLAYCKATKKASTYEAHDRPRVKRFIDFLRDQGVDRASEIAQSHVESYQQHRLENRARNTVRNDVYAASGLLKYAANRGYIDNNVVRKVKKVKTQTSPPRYLDPKELQAVFDTARRTHLWPLVPAAYFTGFRSTELCYLEWSDIDFDQELVTVQPKENFSPKNHQFRSVPLHQKLKSILGPYRKDAGWCFLSRSGRQLNSNIVSKDFKKFIADPCGLDGVTFHTLRHTFASHLVMDGVPVLHVCKLLGHESVQTTMRYAHVKAEKAKIQPLGTDLDLGNRPNC